MISAPDTCAADPGVPVRRQTPESFPSDVLDLEGLTNRCMGNIDLVQRVLAKFEQQLPEELAELERSLGLRDTEQIARIAHRVKGTSASMSAESLRRAAAAIESLGRTGCVTDVSKEIEHLRGEWERYLEYASTLLPAGDTE
jgi:HPt (histidine-containing phosphotransfer) domain-containing protein